ncbi:MAG: hypothetical protein IKS55_12650 [Oscillospiraceae bacterium]|nr:hypothetical protein [Oscillospiraceae bacterium]
MDMDVFPVFPGAAAAVGMPAMEKTTAKARIRANRRFFMIFPFFLSGETANLRDSAEPGG